MKDLTLFNSYVRRKVKFIPLDADKVTVYTCGPTVYDYPHIGNLRAYVFADTLKRVLLYNGFSVNHVMNITDVGHLVSDADEGEDKIELRAKTTKQSAWDIADFYTNIFKEDLILLNILSPDTLSKATDHIEDQIALIKKLEELGYAYRISDGLYFDTAKFPSYGKMARLKLEALKPGARVEFNPEKRNITDFALWKFSPLNTQREMQWQSTWGMGFPGWHIECSAMSMRYLGETIDIHTGGIDHIPVHHTNEIAQSEAATGKQFVRYWLHCAFLLVEGKKMSKSLRNIFTLQDIITKGYDPLSFRYLLLTSHYRSQMNFTWESLRGSQSALSLLRSHISMWPDGGVINVSRREKFNTTINNDLDTPRGIALLWEIIKSNLSDADKKATILNLDQVLGLKLSESVSDVVSSENIPADIQDLVSQREQFRKTRDWAGADRIRNEILTAGYNLEDTSNGVRLRKVSRSQ